MIDLHADDADETDLRRFFNEISQRLICENPDNLRHLRAKK